MSITVTGIVHGRRIDLDVEPKISDGAQVIVRIERKCLTTEDKRRAITATAGAWADDPSLEAVFTEIARRRHETVPREASLE